MVPDIIEYVSSDEIEVHEAAMQGVVEDEKRERQAINKKRRMAVEQATRAAEDEAQNELKKAKDKKDKKLAAMQRDLERLSLLRRAYHEAPNDVLELILSKCSQVDFKGWGSGGLNAFRLANRRLKLVIESFATILTNQLRDNGPESLPIPIIQRCRRIEIINSLSHNLMTLEGCSIRLRMLWIAEADLSDLSPLAFCSAMTDLQLYNCPVTDISAVASLTNLKVFWCRKRAPGPSIKDLSPLSSCLRLTKLLLYGNRELKDLSPLSFCTALEYLEISSCPLITSLAPVSNLVNLQVLQCKGVDPQTSLLPFASCIRLKEISCAPDSVDLEDLRGRRPDLVIWTW